MSRLTRLLALVLLASASLVSAATSQSTSPTTTNNDDTCDIGIYPAATLLLPYFEVDVSAPAAVARTTLFTIVNTTRIPQIAHVTVWTDYAYPVLDFPIFLTGYDVQALNMYDILARGLVAPPGGTSNATSPGSRSVANNANPNFLPSAQTSCGNLGGGVIPANLLADIRTALTTGTTTLCPNQKIGGTHANAAGYVTIDVVATCNPVLPTSPEYYGVILFDNVLTGDFQDISPNPTTGNYAGGNPLVHIRAVPEGGEAGKQVATGLPYTFYDRYTPSDFRRIDRRQPLPSAFAARYIQGGGSGFNTDVLLWREGSSGGSDPSCATFQANGAMQFGDVVRFDERENPRAIEPCELPAACPGGPPPPPTTSAASRVASHAARFPPLTSGDVAGWFYLNLNNGGSSAYSTAPGRNFPTGVGPRQSQNWVTLTMFAEGRFSVTSDATQLANGCTPANAPAGPTGPGPNVTP